MLYFKGQNFDPQKRQGIPLANPVGKQRGRDNPVASSFFSETKQIGPIRCRVLCHNFQKPRILPHRRIIAMAVSSYLGTIVDQSLDWKSDNCLESF